MPSKGAQGPQVCNQQILKILSRRESFQNLRAAASRRLRAIATLCDHVGRRLPPLLLCCCCCSNLASALGFVTVEFQLRAGQHGTPRSVNSYLLAALVGKRSSSLPFDWRP